MPRYIGQENSNFIRRLQKMAGTHLKYKPEPIELFFNSTCFHAPKCDSRGACLRRSDGPRRRKDVVFTSDPADFQGLLPRRYYYQLWADVDSCPYCFEQMRSPMASYEKHSPEKEEKIRQQGVLLLLCRYCDIVLAAYQPISPLQQAKPEENGKGKEKNGQEGRKQREPS